MSTETDIFNKLVKIEQHLAGPSRAEVAAQIMAALTAAGELIPNDDATIAHAADIAVRAADAVIARLAQEGGGS